MHLEHQGAGGGIGGHHVVLVSQVDAGRWRLHDKHAAAVVAARLTDGIDERLLVLDECGDVGGLVLALVASGVGLVHAGKEQVVVVVAEAGGNLFPHHAENGAVLADRRRSLVGKRPLNPAVVVVVVQNDIEAVVDAVVNDLLHTVHPRRADVVVLVHVDIP